MIKTKPIASHRIDLYTEQSLRNWFETEYRPVLEETGIYHRDRIYNINEKSIRICIPIGEEVVVLIEIKEIYIGIPENRISLTIIEYISADSKVIPLVVIIPGIIIMVSWFYENITGYKVIIVSPTGYINEGIYMVWLDHFIKYNNYSPNKKWHILLINGATCYQADDFILKAIFNKIRII
jgi:hypothetical protein